MWLRCRHVRSQADRELQPWFERTADAIARGETACVRPNWERMRDGMWLFAGDPT
jgi:hypothetical protein